MKRQQLLLINLLLALLCKSPIVVAAVDDSLLRVIQNTKDIHNKLRIFIDLSGALSTKDFDASIQYANKGMILAIQEHDSIAIAKLKTIIGEANYFKGKYDVAANYFFGAITIFEKSKDNKDLAYTFNNLAKLYRKTRDLDKAENYYQQALQLFEEVNDTAGIQMIWNESGVVFEYKKNYGEALKRYNKSLEIAQQRNDLLGVGYALNNISGVYTIQKKFVEAEKYLYRALEIRKEMKDSFALAINYSDLGAMYAKKKDYNTALTNYTSSNEIADKMHYAELLSANYKEMATITNAMGNYSQAFEFLQSAQNIRDSIFTAEKQKQIAELNTKYETEKKEQQLFLQQIQINRKNYLLIGIAVFIFLSALLSYSYYKRYQLKQAALLQQSIMQQQDIATKAVLEAEERERQRIAQDLHDGVGQMMSAVKLNLSAFQSELQITDEQIKNKFENIFSLVDDSCKEVRSVSHNMMPNALLKNGLSTAVREFLNKIDSNALEVNLYVEGLDEHLNSDVEIMLYRVIQECVNNAVKHAGASKLDLSIIREEKNLSVSIEDNGKGFDTSDMDLFSGIGLKNIISRVEYLKGNIEFDAKENKGTAIIIHVPLA